MQKLIKSFAKSIKELNAPYFRSTFLKNYKIYDLVNREHYVVEGSAKGSARGIYKLNISTYKVQYAVSNTFH